jgi:hypothetical protein
VCAAFALVIAYKIIYGLSHFQVRLVCCVVFVVRRAYSQTTHEILGLIIIILMIFEPVLGFVADRWWSADRKGTPSEWCDVLCDVITSPIALA